MKAPRSMNRRTFNVEPAGYFNVLTPGKRFAAPHPRGEFSYLPGQSRAIAANAPALELISAPGQNVNPAIAACWRLGNGRPGSNRAQPVFFVWWSAGLPHTSLLNVGVQRKAVCPLSECVQGRPDSALSYRHLHTPLPLHQVRRKTQLGGVESTGNEKSVPPSHVLSRHLRRAVVSQNLVFEDDSKIAA